MYDNHDDGDDGDEQTEYGVFEVDNDEPERTYTNRRAAERDADRWSAGSFDYEVRPLESDDNTDDEDTTAEADTDSDQYEFFNIEDQYPSVEEEPEENTEIRRWSLGAHTEAPERDWDVLEAELTELENAAPGLRDALEQAKGVAESYRVNGYECPVCGLNHGHSDTKHDIRDEYRTSAGFSVRPEFAEQMKYNPFCHCGVNELARLMDFFGAIGVPVFRDEDEAFPDVRSIGQENIDAVLRTYNDRNDDPDVLEYTMDEAVADALGNLPSATDVVMADLAEQFTAFHERYQDIKSAARHAPIPDETSARLDELFAQY